MKQTNKNPTKCNNNKSSQTNTISGRRNTPNLNGPSNSQTYIQVGTLCAYICTHTHLLTQRNKTEGGEPGNCEVYTSFIRRYGHMQYDTWDICQHTRNLLPINDDAKPLRFKKPPKQ